MFVNETVPDADKERFESWGLICPTTRKAVKPWKWSIDRARDAALVALCGQGDWVTDVPMFYALVWRGRIIEIETHCKATGNSADGFGLLWKVGKVTAPKALAPEQDTVLALVREALDANGLYFDRSNVKEVRF